MRFEVSCGAGVQSLRPSAKGLVGLFAALITWVVSNLASFLTIVERLFTDE